MSMGKKEGKLFLRRKTKFKSKKQPIQFQLDQLPNTPKAWIISKKVVAIVTFLITLTGIFVVWPRLSVYPGEALDPFQPFETPFIIKNDGYLPLFDIDYSIRAEKVKDMNNNSIINSTFTGLSIKIPKISANTSSAISIPIHQIVVFPAKNITYVELYFYITYKLSIIPITFKEARRFKTDRKSDGSFVWNEYYSKE